MNLTSTELRPHQGHCPASPHSNSQSLKAGQRVSLTIYCPWATCFPLSSPFWAAAPKGTKSCRTQGDFRSFVRACVPPLRPHTSSLKPHISPQRLKSQSQGLDISLEAQIPASKNKQTNESPPVFYRTSSPSGPLPKSVRWSAIPVALLSMFVTLGDD